MHACKPRSANMHVLQHGHWRVHPHAHTQHTHTHTYAHPHSPTHPPAHRPTPHTHTHTHSHTNTRPSIIPPTARAHTHTFRCTQSFCTPTPTHAACTQPYRVGALVRPRTHTHTPAWALAHTRAHTHMDADRGIVYVLARMHKPNSDPIRVGADNNAHADMWYAVHTPTHTRTLTPTPCAHAHTHTHTVRTRSHAHAHPRTARARIKHTHRITQLSGHTCAEMLPTMTGQGPLCTPP